MRIFYGLFFLILSSCSTQVLRTPAQESHQQLNQLTSSDLQLERVQVSKDKKSGFLKKIYSFRVCDIKDVLTDSTTTLIGQEFRIVSEIDLNGQLARVGNDACLHWQNAVSYKGDVSVNLSVNYLLFATHGTRKTIRKIIGLNPWAQQNDNTPEFFDYTRFGLSEKMSREKWAAGAHEIQLALEANLY